MRESGTLKDYLGLEEPRLRSGSLFLIFPIKGVFVVVVVFLFLSEGIASALKRARLLSMRQLKIFLKMYLLI